MNAVALLSLIGELYAQVASLNERCTQLAAEVDQLRTEHETA